jgi:hypothetical protein
MIAAVLGLVAYWRSLAEAALFVEFGRLDLEWLGRGGESERD